MANDPATPQLLAGKKGLIVGLANERSIAWGIAQRAHAAGAELAYTYQGEALLKRVQPLTEATNAKAMVPMDVTNEASVDAAFSEVADKMGSLDFLVHSVAYADRDALKGRTVDTSLEGFLMTMEISVYSLILLARKAEPLMNPGGSIIAMTYLGSVKSMPSYNVMGIAKAALESTVRYLARDMGEKGIRVNAISAGPIKTLAASGVSGLRTMLADNAQRAPLKRNVNIDDVGRTALYLISDLSTAVTGEVHYVDAGFASTAF